MANQGKTIVEADQRFGSSQTQEPVSFQNTEEIIDELSLDPCVEIYHDVATENNINEAFKGEFRIHKIESPKQYVPLQLFSDRIESCVSPNPLSEIFV
jgi:hypothetical protein